MLHSKGDNYIFLDGFISLLFGGSAHMEGKGRGKLDSVMVTVYYNVL